jgi:hypothetical protein
VLDQLLHSLLHHHKQGCACSFCCAGMLTIQALIMPTDCPGTVAAAHHASMRSGVAASAAASDSVAFPADTACAGQENVQPLPLIHCTVARARPRKVPGCVQCVHISLSTQRKHQAQTVSSAVLHAACYSRQPAVELCCNLPNKARTLLQPAKQSPHNTRRCAEQPAHSSLLLHLALVPIASSSMQATRCRSRCTKRMIKLTKHVTR